MEVKGHVQELVLSVHKALGTALNLLGLGAGVFTCCTILPACKSLDLKTSSALIICELREFSTIDS